MSAPQVALHIAGQDIHSQKTFDVISPDTGKVVRKGSDASWQEIEQALDSANKAQPAWEEVPPSRKREILLKAADLIASDKYGKRINEAMQAETAASPTWCHINQAASVNLLKEAASQASQIKGQYIKSERADLFIVTRRAAGVVYAVSPWNAPVNLSFRAIAIPLICGNTVVLRASEASPASQRLVVDCLVEAGLPPSVLHFITFGREAAGELTSKIIAHPAVRRVNFTGSDHIGRIIAQECGKNLKQCILELGGKAPVVVLNDADLDVASSGIVQGAMIHSGQVCMSTERVIAQSGIVKKLTELIVEKAGRLRAGAAGSGDKLTALFNPASAGRVLKQLQDAKAGGAKVELGAVPDKPDGDYATLLQPHVLSSVSRDLSVWKNETFGPVVTITSVETIDEAVEAANDSPFSLMAALWTTNLHSGVQVAQRIRAGHVAINSATISIEPSFGNAGVGECSGFLRFDISSFTDERSIGFYKPGEKFPLID